MRIGIGISKERKDGREARKKAAIVASVVVVYYSLHTCPLTRSSGSLPFQLIGEESERERKKTERKKEEQEGSEKEVYPFRKHEKRPTIISRCLTTYLVYILPA